ncbi:40S ribosomal protein S7-2 [Striga hermonthica]|uniref:40S ribosomal protein S7 n=1 Tax=Striga hermonthica TaxID=68872 RepID=A0A9N7NYX3_STRHE|nr:40S ribosomal protein S7-2 [Striga hermonthica]
MRLCKRRVNRGDGSRAQWQGRHRYRRGVSSPEVRSMWESCERDRAELGCPGLGSIWTNVGQGGTARVRRSPAGTACRKTAGNLEIKSDLKDLYINSASQIDVSGGKKAVVIRVPYRLRKPFCKIQPRLVRELEKKFSRKVNLRYIVRIVRPPKKGFVVQRQRTRTLTVVHDAMLEDIVYPVEIVEKRVRYRLDGSKIMKNFIRSTMTHDSIEVEMGDNLTGHSNHETFEPNENRLVSLPQIFHRRPLILRPYTPRCCSSAAAPPQSTLNRPNPNHPDIPRNVIRSAKNHPLISV